jgi:hypothetical protein
MLSLKSFEGMVEAIFGAEETDEHNDLFSRFRKKKHREVGHHTCTGMETQSLEQSQVHESTGNGGDANKSELGNNLCLSSSPLVCVWCEFLRKDY